MKKYSIIATALLVFFSCAQVRQTAHRQMPNAMPILRITNDSTAKDIRVSSLQVDIKVAANIATTTFDVVFFNPNERVLEGEFEFPLADGQNIVRYALDMDGKLREGVVVEKTKARVAFENTIRRKVDPGLVEKTKGNNFRTRIYPLPAKGTRHIVIAIEQVLDADNGNYFYQLPLNSNTPVEKFSAAATVIKGAERPVPDEKNTTGFGFDKTGNDWVAKSGKTNTVLNENIAFNVPLPEDGSIVLTENYNGQTYFYANSPVDAEYKKRNSPASVGILWDISASGEKRDIKKEKQLLEKYLTAVGSSKLSLITFNVFANTKEDFTGAEALLKRIDELRYDGGTQFGAVDLSQYSFDEILLFSDGLATFGKKEINFSSAPVIAVNSSSSADFSHLKFIARQSHGKFIDLSKLDEVTALKEMTSETLQVVRADFDPAEIEDLVLPVSPVQSSGISVAGQLKAASATVKLSLGYGTEVTESKTITIIKSDSSDYDAVKRIWATMKIAELDLQFERNKEAITKLGKEFSVVTQNTSLIVLDRVEDYVEHEITPPAELQKEYFALLKTKKAEEGNQKQMAMDDALAAMTELKEWYTRKNQPVQKPAPPEDVITSTVPFTNASDSTAVLANSLPNPSDSGRAGVQAGQFTAPTIQHDANAVYLATTDSLSVTAGVGAYSTTASTANGSTFYWGTSDADGVADQLDAEEKSNKAEEVKIEIKEWMPDELYLNDLKNTPNAQLKEKYFELKKKFAEEPSFFIDVARFFISKKEKQFGLQVLSNVAEMKLENAELIRNLANQLLEAGETELALETFKDAMKMREEDPQSYRDLALAYNEAGEYDKAVELLYKVITGYWDARFGEIKAIAINEMNAIISAHKGAVNTAGIDSRLIYAMPVDVRIVIGWSSDNTDIDLWVTDPNTEKCDYSHNATVIGGKLSHDVTQGFGPEEFCLRKAINGKYKIEVNLFGSTQQTISGPMAIKADLYTNYGRSNQKKETINFRVKENKEVVELGSLKFGS